MRTFEHFPKQSICPICGKNEDKLCVLVAIAGTQKDNIVEAKPFHLDCINLTLVDTIFDDRQLVQSFKNKEK